MAALVPIVKQAYGTSQRTKGFMFLGGELDHTIRTVPPDEINPGRPSMMTVLHQSRLGGDPVQYTANRCASGPRVWWCFILDGYSPPVGHLLDADPHTL